MGESGEKCWESILKKDIIGLGKAMTDTFLSWKKISASYSSRLGDERNGNKYFPNYPGAITSGSGGGYVIVVSEKKFGGIRLNRYKRSDIE